LPVHPSTWLKTDNTGLYCEPGGFYIDPMTEVDTALVTHGHADHARAGHHTVYASVETLAIMQTRYGEDMAVKQHTVTLGEKLTFKDVTVTLPPTPRETCQLLFSTSRLISERERDREDELEFLATR